MSESQQTFINPQTGQEVPSTVLARGMGRLFYVIGHVLGWGLIIGLAVGSFFLLIRLSVCLVFMLIDGFSFDHVFQVLGQSWLFLAVCVVLDWGLVVGWPIGLIVGLIIGLKPENLHTLRNDLLFQEVHDRLAGRQHQRRQRILRQKQLEAEWAGVPAGAISRAGPPKEPEPTGTSLSPAETPEKDRPPHLATGMDAATEPEEQSLML